MSGTMAKRRQKQALAKKALASKLAPAAKPQEVKSKKGK